MVEDFESGNLNAWSVVAGSATISGSTIFTGSSALQMGVVNTPPANISTLLTHNTFQGAFGKYQVHFNCEGPDSEFRFYFQYAGQNNHYQVICRPSDGNSPELRLERTSGDVVEILAVVTPNFEQGEWHELVVDRPCDNDIFVLVDGEEMISVNDAGIQVPGSVALGAWSEFTYTDDLRFDPYIAKVEILGDTTFCYDPILLEASAVFSEYNWSTGSNRPSVEVEEQGVLSLEVTDENGCKGRDSVLVVTYCPTLFFAPNIFSPNYDGVNDIFQIFPEKQVQDYYIKVFNRWGEMVFASENVSEGWDGSLNGRTAPADMYLWIANLDGFTVNGSVVLMR